uniref:Uncharacterized protein n=1 Tax=Knipowitschia caucasica TaxID=637954 RepID=A0AAV2J8J6_KNICA
MCASDVRPRGQKQSDVRPRGQKQSDIRPRGQKQSRDSSNRLGACSAAAALLCRSRPAAAALPQYGCQSGLASEPTPTTAEGLVN